MLLSLYWSAAACWFDSRNKETTLARLVPFETHSSKTSFHSFTDALCFPPFLNPLTIDPKQLLNHQSKKVSKEHSCPWANETGCLMFCLSSSSFFLCLSTKNETKRERNWKLRGLAYPRPMVSSHAPSSHLNPCLTLPHASSHQHHQKPKDGHDNNVSYCVYLSIWYGIIHYHVNFQTRLSFQISRR